MKKLVITAVALTSLGCFLVAPGFSAVADDVNAKTIEGTWSGLRWLEGKGDSDDGGAKLSLTFKKGQLIGTRGAGGTGGLIGEATFELSKDGKGFDAVGTSKGYAGKKYGAIVKIDGDSLLLCIQPNARPADYVAGVKGSVLMKLKRAK